MWPASKIAVKNTKIFTQCLLKTHLVGPFIYLNSFWWTRGTVLMLETLKSYQLSYYSWVFEAKSGIFYSLLLQLLVQQPIKPQKSFLCLRSTNQYAINQRTLIRKDKSTHSIIVSLFSNHLIEMSWVQLLCAIIIIINYIFIALFKVLKDA